MFLTRRDAILGLLGAAMVPSTAGADVHTTGGFAFGSSWRITAGRTTDFSGALSKINAVISEVDSQMSPFRSTSLLSRFNTSGERSWQPMAPALCHVTAEALRIARLTDGAFDPTIGPLVSRFGFGPIRGGLGSFVGIEARKDELRKVSSDLTLDLCGIAKGYALDQIALMLTEAGIFDALVEVGGEVKALGRHPSGRSWQVAIADPIAPVFKAHRIVTPGGHALATSGHASNGYSGSITTSHIIDPSRNRPASTKLASVSVLAPTAIEADALATALCAAGPRAGVAMARRLGVAALFILDDAKSTADIVTGHFEQHLLI